MRGNHYFCSRIFKQANNKITMNSVLEGRPALKKEVEKIAEVENIQPTEEEVNEEISKMAETYKMEADKLKELLGEREIEQIKKDMAVQKAVSLVADAAKEV